MKQEMSGPLGCQASSIYADSVSSVKIVMGRFLTGQRRHYCSMGMRWSEIQGIGLVYKRLTLLQVMYRKLSRKNQSTIG